VGLFGGLFHVSSVTKVFHIFFYIVCAIILQLTAYYPRKIMVTLYTQPLHIAESGFVLRTQQSEARGQKQKNQNFSEGGAGKVETFSRFSLAAKDKIINYKSFMINKMAEQFKILEYSLIILFIISGAILLMSTSDLISMFLSIELQSYGLYILSTIYKNSELATKGGLTYFLLGGLSSCFILLGSCLLYSNTATTNLDGIYVITSLTGSSNAENNYNVYEPNYINISLIIMSVGFLFKISAAPFHF
jgi:NADH-ubiquinone oxidoreductase chain 2